MVIHMHISGVYPRPPRCSCVAMLFVANVLVLRYTLDNQELPNLSLSRTSQALGNKLL